MPLIGGSREVTGYGFNSNGRYSAKALLDERFLPRLRDALRGAMPSGLDPETGFVCPFRCWDLLMANEKPGGHGERSVAVGTLDMALWDALAKVHDLPLWRLLSSRYNGGQHDPEVSVYAAGGYYYPGKGLADLQDEMKSYLDRGFVNVKMKIGGLPKPGAARGAVPKGALEMDRERIEAVLRIVPPGSRLAVDANGRFDLATAVAYGEMLKPYVLDSRILWYEEAGDPLDYQLQADLSKHMRDVGIDVPMATGENLFSSQDARNLLRHGGMDRDRDVLQFDCALSYGLVEYFRTLGHMDALGWSRRRVIPHGGHQMSLQMAAGLQLGGNEAYPDVFQPFSGFSDDAPIVGGHVRMGEAPGVGFEGNASLYAVMRSMWDSE